MLKHSRLTLLSLLLVACLLLLSAILIVMEQSGNDSYARTVTAVFATNTTLEYQMGGTITPSSITSTP